MQTPFARDLPVAEAKTKSKAQMSIYSVSLKTISRSAGRSATAAAAYRTGTEVIDERTGVIFDYTRRSGVDHVSMHLPAGTVEMDTHTLWNAAEHAEKRKNSTVARELVIAQPSELNRMQRHALSAAIADSLVERYNVAVQASNHLPDKEGDQRNFHVHLQITTRIVNANGTFGAKTRVLDDMSTGPSEVLWIRKMVEEKTNAALKAAGINSRVDCRSLSDQREAALAAGDLELADKLNRLPTIHEGPRVTQIRREAERNNRKPFGALDRAAANDEIININAMNAERRTLAQVISFEVAKIARAAKEVTKEVIEDIGQRLTRIKSKKAEVIKIKPRILARDRELEDALEKYGRQYFNIPDDTKSSAVKAPISDPLKPAQVKAPVKKRRQVPDDDFSP